MKVIVAIVLALVGIAAMPEAIFQFLILINIGEVPEEVRRESIFRAVVWIVATIAYIWFALWLIKSSKNKRHKMTKAE